jgi:hypothetical protein
MTFVIILVENSKFIFRQTLQAFTQLLSFKEIKAFIHLNNITQLSQYILNVAGIGLGEWLSGTVTCLHP